MATRAAMIATGAAVDITAALALEAGRGYLIEIGPGAKADDSVWIAAGGDPNDLTIGGHLILPGTEAGRLIRQGSAAWFARFYDLPARETQLTATEADDCN